MNTPHELPDFDAVSPPRYSDEVLNASWLPSIPVDAPGTADSGARAATVRDTPAEDADAFLQRLYRAQE